MKKIKNRKIKIKIYLTKNGVKFYPTLIKLQQISPTKIFLW